MPVFESEILAGTITAAGIALTFSKVMAKVTITVRNFAGGTTVAFGQLNGIPDAATNGVDKFGFLDSTVLEFTGAIRSVGFKTDAGTALVEVKGVEGIVQEIGANVS